jgi:signal transduction histidine kinase
MTSKVVVKSAALKLTMYYLALIMGLSIGFSLFLYHISSGELQRGLRRPEGGNVIFVSKLDYEQFRQDRIDEAQDNLRFNLIVFNILILVVGGFISAVMANRTLEPIEEAMEAQSRFTADASHELRTPLTAMQTEIEVALRKPDLSVANAKELLQSNLEEVSKLRNLSDSLLKLARHSSQALDMQPVSLEDIGIEAITPLVKAAQSKHISIENNLKPLIVMADKQILTEALGILLDNAVKYSPSKTTITLSSRQDEQTARIEVQDHGQGVSAKDLPHVFDRFFRSDDSRSKNQIDGYGLGLAIAKQMIELHDGSLIVISKPGKGSTFTISLPIYKLS